MRPANSPRNGSRCAFLQRIPAGNLRNRFTRGIARACTPLLLAALPCASVTVAVAQSTGQQPFVVVLDAAHGGSDTGTLLASQLTEKDLVLRLSIRLRSALTARGMRVVTTREGDTNPTPDTRAGEANHASAGACLVLHATASGSGIHLYTSSLPGNAATSDHASAPVPWAMASAPFATESLQLASDLSRALTSANLPFTLGRVRLAPLDSLRCPAAAVEIAPLRAGGAGSLHNAAAKIDDDQYENRVIDALAAALMQWRSEREHSGGGTR